jgi:hypothetical protein
MTSIFIGRFFRAKPVISLHSEFFAVIGQMRSKVGGQQTVYLSFSLAHKIIFSDKDTYDVASRYRRKHNFELIPMFVCLDEDKNQNGLPALKRLRDKKSVIMFTNLIYPSFMFDILNVLLSESFTEETGVIFSLSETPSSKFQHVIEESGARIAENLVFIAPDDEKMLRRAYSLSDLVVRPMTCDGEMFFQNFAVYIREPMCSGSYIYFQTGLALFKEGEKADMCAFIINSILEKKNAAFHKLKFEDPYKRIEAIYKK